MELDFCCFFYFHPSLLGENIGFDAGPVGQGLVKIQTHPYLCFWVAPKNWLLWPGCTQEGRFIDETSLLRQFFYINPRGIFGK